MSSTLTERATKAFKQHTQTYTPVSLLDYRMGFEEGFQAGWREESNRPYFCAFCTFECHGDDNAQTLALITEHVMSCPYHPLNVRIRDLEATLAVQQTVGETTP